MVNAINNGLAGVAHAAFTGNGNACEVELPAHPGRICIYNLTDEDFIADG
jgi:hypothetical protein